MKTRRPNAVVLLDVLLAGCPISKGDETY